jgi:hypothetical protein
MGLLGLVILRPLAGDLAGLTARDFGDIRTSAFNRERPLFHHSPLPIAITVGSRQ